MLDRAKEEARRTDEPQIQRDKDSSQAGGDNSPSPFTTPAISLPKGGGAIRGMGEKFAANPVTGAGL